MQDKKAGYTIIKIESVGKYEFVLGHNPNAPSPYVTWKRERKTKDAFWGHYFSNRSKAEADLKKRVRNESAYER